LQEIKKLKIFYGNILKKYIKNSINLSISSKNKKINLVFLKIFEKRLDVVLYRAKFSPNIKNARQLIFHGIILVNYKTVKIKSFKLKSGDLIKINLNY
jgi:small subunit ribosomal protein S4